MKYIRHNINGEWKTIKISDDEEKMLVALTVKKNFEFLRMIKEFLSRKNIDRPDILMCLFEKVATNLDREIYNYVEKMISEGSVNE